ncbi:ethanolamine-phosphate phospho-lyase-like [Amphibalanus amphitrite]|uniref:ethanolamine-phosphate phospho-lyase-like n=1 Tax=Amphibalanus amphitrite TaxID=1232801 RepID=UPI001C90C78C|nr:ethanolamine-phosphate phospho-lyase-like [Amphibalanus amphitrite]
MTVPGIVIPPPGWLRKIHDYMHSLGALVISDEMCTALGRNGKSFWGFQGEDGDPDFICCGKPIGNGYPMAAALTRKDLLKSINQPSLWEQYRPSPLACAIGTTVLRVLEQEDLTVRARDVGAFLKRHLLALKAKHSCVGDVRGEGLLIGVDIVTVSDRKPDRQACQCVVYRLKEEERIIAASEGEHLNVLYITPPLCFSEENARSLVAALDRVLTYMEANGTDINFSSLGASLLEPETEPVDLATYEDVD